jgi:hypothetical protein
MEYIKILQFMRVDFGNFTVTIGAHAVACAAETV